MFEVSGWQPVSVCVWSESPIAGGKYAPIHPSPLPRQCPSSLLRAGQWPMVVLIQSFVFSAENNVGMVKESKW